MLEAIASPRRREILRMVWDREPAAGEIAAGFDVSWPAISQNLAVLRKAGVLAQRRDGTRLFYRADHAAIGPLAEVLRTMWALGLRRSGAPPRR